MKWRIALKYLFSRKSHSVINIIASVSVVALFVPVAAMVVLLSVFNGLEGVLQMMNRATDADVEVRLEGGASFDEAMRSKIASVEGVEAVSFVAERQVLLRYGERQVAATLRGVDEQYERVLPWQRHCSFGSPDLSLGDIDYLILGEGLAHSLGILSTMSQVEILAMGGADVGAILPLSAPRREYMAVGGGFMIDGRSDSSLSLVSLRAAGRIFGGEEVATTAFVKVRDGSSNDKVCRTIESLDGALRATSREERNASFYAIMRYEKWAVFFVSLLVLIIASLSIIGTVVMLIVEKRDERRTLYAMGADSSFVRGIFVREGLLVAGIGGAIGLVVGLLLVLAQQRFGIIALPGDNFLVKHYPVELRVTDMVVIFVTFVAVTLAVSQIATRTMIKGKSLCETD